MECSTITIESQPEQDDNGLIFIKIKSVFTLCIFPDSETGDSENWSSE